MRSLYDCLHPKVLGDWIECDKGHSLATNSNGRISVMRLARGTPLEITECQGCEDYDEMGKPLVKADRGWRH